MHSHQKRKRYQLLKSQYLYQKCGNCNLTAYLKAKEKYDTQRENWQADIKKKTAI